MGVALICSSCSSLSVSIYWSMETLFSWILQSCFYLFWLSWNSAGHFYKSNPLFGSAFTMQLPFVQTTSSWFRLCSCRLICPLRSFLANLSLICNSQNAELPGYLNVKLSFLFFFYFFPGLLYFCLSTTSCRLCSCLQLLGNSLSSATLSIQQQFLQQCGNIVFQGHSLSVYLEIQVAMEKVYHFSAMHGGCR